MLSCTGKRSHRHTILHVSFSNSFGLASARPTPQGLSGAPKEIAPNVWKYGLGFALQIENRNKPADISRCFTLRPRSSVWKTGMVLSNSEATIDDGFVGEISAVFYHVFPKMPRYNVGDKIVQFHLETSDNIMFVETDELNKTERGDNGYGSSDKNGMVL